MFFGQAPRAPAELPKKKAGTFDPNYQTLAGIGGIDVFGEDKKNAPPPPPPKPDPPKPAAGGGGGGFGPGPRAPAELPKKKAATFDPNYQTLAGIGGIDVFGEDKKNAPPPPPPKPDPPKPAAGGGGGFNGPRAPAELPKKKAATFDPNYQTLAGIGGDEIFGEDKKKAMEQAPPKNDAGKAAAKAAAAAEPNYMNLADLEGGGAGGGGPAGGGGGGAPPEPQQALPKAPANVKQKAGVNDPNYQTLAGIGGDVFGEDKKAAAQAAGGGGGWQAPKAPTNVKQKAATHDPNYQTLAGIGGDVFGEDKKAAPQPGGGGGWGGGGGGGPGGFSTPKAPENVKQKAGTHDPNYQTLAGIGGDIFGEDKKAAAQAAGGGGGWSGAGGGGGGWQAPKAPTNVNKKAATHDPNYQTLAGIGGDVFGEDKKNAAPPGGGGGWGGGGGGGFNGPKAPENVKQKAGTHDPNYQTLAGIGGDVFGEDKKAAAAAAGGGGGWGGAGGGGGGWQAPKAPTNVNKKAATHDPNYQTLAGIGGDVFGEDKKNAAPPGGGGGFGGGGGGWQAPKAPTNVKQKAATHDPNYQTLAGIGGDVFGEDKKNAAPADGGWGGGGGGWQAPKAPTNVKQKAATHDPNYQTLAGIGGDVFGEDKKAAAPAPGGGGWGGGGGGGFNGPKAPENVKQKAGTHDPNYQTLAGIGGDIFGEDKKAAAQAGGAGGGGGWQAPKAPTNVKQKAATHDPNYQTLAGIGGDVFGEDKKNAAPPGGGGGFGGGGGGWQAPKAPDNVKQKAATHDPNYQTLAGIGGDVFGEDKKNAAPADGGWGGGAGGGGGWQAPKAPTNVKQKAATHDPNYQTLAGIGGDVFGEDKKAAPQPGGGGGWGGGGGGGYNAPKAPENVKQKAATHDPNYQTLAGIGGDVFGEDKKAAAQGGGGGFGGGGGWQPPKAPSNVKQKAATHDPNYQTLAGIGGDVFGEDKKAAPQPGGGGGWGGGGGGGFNAPKAPENVKQKAATHDPNYQTLAGIGGDVFGEDKKAAAGGGGGFGGGGGGGWQPPKAPSNVKQKAATHDPNYQTLAGIGGDVFGEDKKAAPQPPPGGGGGWGGGGGGGWQQKQPPKPPNFDDFFNLPPS